MKYLEITKENLEKFIEIIRPEDKEELVYFYKEKYKEFFLKIVLQNKDKTYLIADAFNNPVSIGGVVEKNYENKKCGQIWLIGTIYQKKNKIFLFKVIKEKMLKYFKEYDVLFNFIYKTNFTSDIWLKKFNFKFKKTKNIDFKLFYLNTRKAHN